MQELRQVKSKRRRTTDKGAGQRKSLGMMFHSRRRTLRLLAGGLAAAVSMAAGTACDRGGAQSATTATTLHDHGDGAHDHADGEDLRPKIDPCGLVRKAEVAQVLGPVAAAKEAGAVAVVADQRVCGFNLQRGEFGANVGVTDVGAATKFESLRGRFPSAVREVPDLGDRAVWIEAFQLLLVLEGQSLLTVQMTEVAAEVATTEANAIKLAKVAVDRLPPVEGGR